MSRRALLVTLVLAAVAAGQPKESHQFTLDGEVTSTALDPTDANAMLGFADGGIVVFATEVVRAQQFFTFTGHKKAIAACAFLPNGKLVATASQDGTVKVWEVAACRKYLDQMQASNGKAKPAIPQPKQTLTAHPTGVTCLAVRADGAQLLTGGADGAIKLWDAKTGKLTVTIAGAHFGGVKGTLYRPEAEQFVTAGADKTVKVWDATKGTLVQKSEALKTAVNGLAVSSDGKKAAVALAAAKKGAGGQIVLFDLDTLKVESTIDGHGDAVTCVLFHPKTAHLASGGADKTIRVWDLGKLEPVWSAENAEPMRGLAILPTGNRFATFSATRVRWWPGFGVKE